MAVSIMSACCRLSALRLCLLGCFLQVLIQGQVFQAPHAHNVFLRPKRANSFLVEEILQGNLERECYEELCSHEEAREYFEDTQMTEVFWAAYHDGNQCDPNPCLHGGNCTDKRGGFGCSCVAPYHGKVCELGNERLPLTASQNTGREYPKCPTEGPTACHQLCTTSYHTFTCSCMPGFKLQSDRRSCLPEVEFPCGSLPEKFSTSTSLCHHGNCPWQVSVVNSRGVQLCAGVLLGPSSVLTAASCLHLVPDLQSYNFFVVPGNEKRYVPVQALHLHERYLTGYHDNDLALLELENPLTFGPTLIHLCLPTKDFCEKILMHSGKMGIIKREGASQTQELAYMTLDECRSQLNISHPLSNKMFCVKQNGTVRRLRNLLDSESEEPRKAAGNSSRIETSDSEISDCGHLRQGTPVATVDRGTVYLTGLLRSSSTDCNGGGLVFTKVSRYLSWIKPRL